MLQVVDVIDFPRVTTQALLMTYARYLFLAFVGVLAFAGSVQAACFADYKAKRDNPLKLHYGVIQVDVSPCEVSKAVEAQVKGRVKAGGWTLLQVQSVFDDSGLESRKKDAGQYFLRF